MESATHTPIRFYSCDTPVGHLLVMECRHPEAEGERPDIPLGRMCREHVRTWHWCLDREEAWCDGGPPDWVWHVGEIAIVEAEDDLNGGQDTALPRHVRPRARGAMPRVSRAPRLR